MAISKAETDAHFAPKKPPPKQVIDPIALERTIRSLYNPPPKPTSDYERQITKSYSSEMERRKSGKQIAQLGEQVVQSVPPLQVFPDTDVHIPEVAYKYVHGKPLVRPELVKLLPTRMRQLNQWYMKAAKKGIIGVMAKVKKEHFFQEYGVQVDFSELFQLYNGKALDKAILSCFCL